MDSSSGIIKYASFGLNLFYSTDLTGQMEHGDYEYLHLIYIKSD